MRPRDASAPAGRDALSRRALTATVAIPVVVFAVLVLPAWSVALAFGLVAVGAGVEWSRMTARNGRTGYGFALVVAGSAGLLWLIGMRWPDALRVLCAVSVAWWLVALAWVVRFERGLDATVLDGAIARGIAGWLVIVPAWAGLVYLHMSTDNGPLRVLLVLLVVWVADAGAYFAGRRFGARRLAAATSPGKTVEGAAGGMAAVAATGAAAGWWLDMSIAPLVMLTVLCVVAGVASVLGDLLESLVKRRAGVKDSGHALPGHGGILDRIDSLSAAVPVFAVGFDAIGVLR